MIAYRPQFPAFEKWQSMSESEQDALLAKMEGARRWRSLGLRILVALGCVIVAAGIVAISLTR